MVLQMGPNQEISLGQTVLFKKDHAQKLPLVNWSSLLEPFEIWKSPVKVALYSYDCLVTIRKLVQDRPFKIQTILGYFLFYLKEGYRPGSLYVVA
jgi:hypothetical protein